MTLYPAATYRPVPNHGGLMTQHLGLILHVQAGDGSPFGWFCDPSSQASSTWWVSKTGAVEQYVDADDRAWAQAAGNASYNSVETEGQPSEPLTDAQVAALTDLYSWGHQTFGWPLAVAETPGEPGFGWHGMGGTAWGGHIYCPGDLRKAQRAAILARVIGTEGDDMTPDECRAVVHEELQYLLGAIEGQPNSKFRQSPVANLLKMQTTLEAIAAKLGIKP